MLPKSLIVLLLLVCSTVRADVVLPRIFADHMVVQRDRPFKVFGRDNPGQRITVRLHQSVAITTADANGRWLVEVKPPRTGGPYELSVRGSSHKLFTDVLVGEVWLCSGQSNMQWNVANSLNPKQEIAGADYARMRLFHVTPNPARAPQEDIKEGTWRVCSPQTVPYFSAVAYFFGRELHRELDVPIGLIAASSGGTRAEAWTPREALAQLPDMKAMLEVMDMPEDEAWEKHNRDLSKWLSEMGLSNSGPGAEHRPWATSEFDDSSWQTMRLPVMWQLAGLRLNGVVWFRHTIEIPEGTDLGAPATLNLGTIDDFDIAYVNGQTVGSVGGDRAAFWSVKRQYAIPAGALRHGRNVIAVRVMDVGGNGGFGGPAADMKLTVGNLTIPLAGDWRYAVEQQIVLDPAKPRPPVPGAHMSATELYNGMIHPLVPFPVAGVIWYQGESNTRSAAAYRQLLPMMIQAWRERWGDEFPFLIVQLAGHGKYSDDPNPVTPMVEFREIQRQIVERTPKTALAVAVDAGDEDIHPRDKQVVGKRLALQALKRVYGKRVIASGPTIRSATRRDGDVVLAFDNIGSSLHAKDLTKDFAVLNPAGEWSWAGGRIRGDRVILSGDNTADAVAVRYAWQDRPRASLYNSEGLPAVPFEVKIP